MWILGILVIKKIISKYRTKMSEKKKKHKLKMKLTAASESLVNPGITSTIGVVSPFGIALFVLKTPPETAV